MQWVDGSVRVLVGILWLFFRLFWWLFFEIEGNRITWLRLIFEHRALTSCKPSHFTTKEIGNLSTVFWAWNYFSIPPLTYG